MDQETQQALEETINKSNALTLMVNTEGWKILLETFENMKQNSTELLRSVLPGDTDRVLAAHAVWSAQVNTIDEIVKAVSRAISAGDSARQELILENQILEEDLL